MAQTSRSSPALGGAVPTQWESAALSAASPPLDAAGQRPAPTGSGSDGLLGIPGQSLPRWRPGNSAQERSGRCGSRGIAADVDQPNGIPIAPVSGKDQVVAWRLLR